ncbi:POTRA domain-containing protein [Methylocucumis oryzae]|uniref:POTRA domain-containing protein n=1 Tax=Methylocucumis oryzae TaxID=1632867 RepID=UPI000697C37B|nr:POTRA domain-containing protein [Methylocucumis oryzae]
MKKVLYAFLGEAKRVEDVEQARLKLEAEYRSHGYPTVIVEIPEQEVVNGVVLLNVIEGSVDSIKVTGAQYFLPSKIREQVPELSVGKTPYMPKVQEQLAELGKQSADRQVNPIFRAGSTPGKTEVELRVKDKLPLHGSVEMNSRNSEHTSRSRLTGSVRYDNLWQRFHSASLQYQVSPEDSDEVEVWSGTYVLPTGWADTRLALYGVGISSNTQLGASVGGLSVVGTGSIFGARLIKPLPALTDYSHSFTAGLDYKSFNQGITQQGQDSQASPVNYLAWLLAYDASWRYPGVTTSLNNSLHFSIQGLANDAQEFERRRFQAKPNFLYLTSELKQLRDLPLGLRVKCQVIGSN